MRASALLLCGLWLSSFTACGGSSFESSSAPGGASAGSGGGASAGNGGSTSAGNGGSTSAGNGGSTSAGSGGSTSAGNGGSTSAGNGGSTSAGSGGGTSAGSGGSTSAGNGGTSAGNGGSTSAGSGGGGVCMDGATECVGGSAVRTCQGGAWSPPAECPPPPGGCAKSICEQGKCAVAGTSPPNDPPHDCKKLVCSNGQYSIEPDPTDTPPPSGACDAPFCKGDEPRHAPSDGKCSAVRRCDAQANFQCVCLACPVGTVAGLPGNECAMDLNTTVATATSAGVLNPPGKAIDKSASTYWLASGSEATLTLDPPASPMSAVVVSPRLPPLSGPLSFTWTVAVTNAKGQSSKYVQQVNYPAGQEAPSLKIQLNAPIFVEKLEITGSAQNGWVDSSLWGIVEVTYVLCE